MTINNSDCRFTRIAKRVNRDLRVRSGAVDASQVREIAEGRNYNESHPVHQAIAAELKKRK